MLRLYMTVLQSRHDVRCGREGIVPAWQCSDCEKRVECMVLIYRIVIR